MMQCSALVCVPSRGSAAGRRTCVVPCTVLLALILLVACTRAIAPLQVPRQADVALSGGSTTSMIDLARTNDGVLAIDLGWWGHSRSLAQALDRLGASATDVRWVFLTHSHRDHIAAWPEFRRARFFVGAAEDSLLVGATKHEAIVPGLSERVKPSGLPREGELDLHAFSGDTTFVIGNDTLRAFLVPGHTSGSAVYLFRGILFLGDAVTYTWWGGFAPAKRGVSDDRRVAASNLEKLWQRLPEGAVRYACTAHARCSAFNERFLRDVAR